MQKILSGEPEWYTPPGQTAGEPEKSYLIATPTIIQAARFGRDVAAEGARMVTDADLRAALSRYVGEVDGGAGSAGAVRAEAVLAAWAADALDDAGRDDLADLEAMALRHDERYRSLVADRQFWTAAASALAVQHFVLEWRGVIAAGEPVDIRREKSGLPDASVAAISELHRLQIFGEVMARMRPDREQVKNSKPPSSPSAGAMNSSAAKDTPAKPRRRSGKAGT